MLPNYHEISKLLPNEMLVEIYNLSLKKRSESVLQVKSSVVVPKQENPQNEPIYIDNNELYFGLFPKTMLNELNNDISIELRISAFNKFRALFDQNIDNQDFLKHISAFYSWVVNFTGDIVNTITLSALQMIGNILSRVPGVSILTNIHISIPYLLDCLGLQNVQIREEAKSVFSKIMMIIPTSQLLPYLVKELKEFNWIKVSGIVSLLTYMFKELRSIYNDIDFLDKSFDEMIIVEMIRLLQHNTPKVVSEARKLIQVIGNEVYERGNFLKTMKFYISEELYNELEGVLMNKPGRIKVSNYDFATERVVNDLIRKK
jgi:hypothetical protein